MHFLLADDHTLFRDGLGKILSGMDAGIRIHEAASAAEVLAHLDRPIFFSLILLDWNMPGMEGMATLRKIKSLTESPVVIVSGMIDTAQIRSLFREGVAGFIPKTLKSEVLLAALRLVLSGGVYMPENLLSEGAMGEDDEGSTFKITRRQREVLQEVAKGKSNREIAETLSITEFTVRIHVASLLKAVDARNRTHLVAIAREKGIV